MAELAIRDSVHVSDAGRPLQSCPLGEDDPTSLACSRTFVSNPFNIHPTCFCHLPQESVLDSLKSIPFPYPALSLNWITSSSNWV
jgi:hypothetical protein